MAAVVVPSNIGAARMAVRDAGRILRRVQAAPSGTEGLVAEIRAQLDALPPGVTAGMKAGSQLVSMRSPEVQLTEAPWEATELRVRPLRVSARGKEPTVEFASDSEGMPFTVKVSLDQAKRLGSVLLTQVDVSVVLCRGTDGRIVDGRVVEVFELQRDCVAEAWRSWFADTGDWDEVEDIGAALGRN